MRPLELVFEVGGLPAYDLPDRLRELYGGGVGFTPERLYANFVSSLDGVVALSAAEASSGPVISGHSQADRFVMGLLRACADAVLIGAGTLRADPRHFWTADHAYPGAAAEYAELRRRLGRSAQPRLVVVTSSGALAPRHPALQAGALILTTGAGAARLESRTPGASTVLPIGEGRVLEPQRVLEAIRAEGHRVLLCEGGPHLIGKLLAARLVDELFLTLSPVLAGRPEGDRRMGLVEGTALLPASGRWATLLSLRRHDSHLFLRYDVSRRVEMGRPSAA